VGLADLRAAQIDATTAKKKKRRGSTPPPLGSPRVDPAEGGRATTLWGGGSRAAGRWGVEVPGGLHR
jgi:hypothetical protein